MPDIVYQRGKANDLFLPPSRLLVEFIFALEQLSASPTDSSKKPARDMHYAYRVLKARMHRTWINHFCPSELANSPQALKRRVVYDLTFQAVQMNESMDGIADFKFARH
jgi:hypothetical protein